MPNPSIAIAVVSYAGSINIGFAFGQLIIHSVRSQSPISRDTAAKDVRTLRISDTAKSRFAADGRP